MTNLGEVRCFFGLKVKKQIKDIFFLKRHMQRYFLSQKAYARKLLQRFDMGKSKEKFVQMEPHLIKAEGKSLKDAKKFQQLVDSLILLTIT